MFNKIKTYLRNRREQRLRERLVRNTIINPSDLSSLYDFIVSGKPIETVQSGSKESQNFPSSV